MLNLYQLQMFVAVADAGSFSAAARQLHMTQPAISMSVAALEKTVGDPLFKRRGQRVELTPLGHRLLGPARQMMSLAEQTEQALHTGRGALAGRLRLGCATGGGALDLARLLGSFQQAHPAVQISLAYAAPAEVLDQVRAGELDAALLPERVRGRSLEHKLLSIDEWVLVAPPDHPWSRQAAPPAGRPDESPAAPPEAPLLPELPLPTPDQLREQPLVLVSSDLRPGFTARGELPAVLEERGVAWREVRVALELPTDLAVLAAVEAGAGVGLVSGAVLVGWQGPLGRFRLRGGALLRQLYLARERRQVAGPVAAAWWDWAERGIGAAGQGSGIRDQGSGTRDQ